MRILFYIGMWFGACSAFAGDLTVDLTTQWGDRQRFHQGDEVRLLVNLNQDAYLLLFYRDAKNRLFQVYPNTYAQSGFHKGGLYLPLAGESAPFRFVVTAPYGLERFYLYASDKPFPRLESRPQGAALLKRSNIEAIAKVLYEHARQAKGQLRSAHLDIETAPR